VSHRSLIFGAILFGAINALPRALPAEEARAAIPAAGSSASLLGNFSLANRNEPISVDADTLELSYRDRVLTYRGRVKVTQGDLTLRSDVLTVTFNDNAADRLKQVVAEGRVEISKGGRSASGGRAVFDQQERTVQLTQDAVLLDGPNRITGERVVVYLDEERSVVEGGEKRVQAVLFPPRGDEAQVEPKGGSGNE